MDDSPTTASKKPQKTKSKPGPKTKGRVVASSATRQTIYLSPATRKLIEKHGTARKLTLSRIVEDCTETVLRMKSPVLSRFYQDMQTYFDGRQGTPPWKILEAALEQHYASQKEQP